MTTTLVQSEWGGQGLPGGEPSNIEPKTTEDTQHHCGCWSYNRRVACCRGVGSLACATHSSTRQPHVSDTLS